MKIQYKEDGRMKTAVQNQYLLWSLEHAIEHKLSVVRTLHELNSIIIDKGDRREEERHNQHSLECCQCLG